MCTKATAAITAENNTTEIATENISQLQAPANKLKKEISSIFKKTLNQAQFEGTTSRIT
jgi:hypothetical protein